MENLNFITPRLATGGDLPFDSDAAVGALGHWQRLGITHVIDCRVEWSDEDLVAEHAPEIQYLHNGTDDGGQRMHDSWFDTGTDFVLAALTDPNNTVLVHCHMGINRGPSLAYAALLAAAWDPIEAMDSIRAARPIAGLAYAEDALNWHHRRSQTPSHVRASDRLRLRQWRNDNRIDVPRIIRNIRSNYAS